MHTWKYPLLFFIALIILSIGYNHFLPKPSDEAFFVWILQNYQLKYILNATNINGFFLSFYIPFYLIHLKFALFVCPALLITFSFLVINKACQITGIHVKYAAILFMTFILLPHVSHIILSVMTESMQLFALALIMLSLVHMHQSTISIRHFQTLPLYLMSTMLFSLTHHGLVFIILLLHGFVLTVLCRKESLSKWLMIFSLMFITVLPAAHADYLLKTLLSNTAFKTNALILMEYAQHAKSGRLDYSPAFKPDRIVSKQSTHSVGTSPSWMHLFYFFLDKLYHYFLYFLGALFLPLTSYANLYVWGIAFIRILLLFIVFYQIYLSQENLRAMNMTFLMLYTAISFVYSCGTQNYGTALRHHMISDVVLIFLFCLNYPTLRKRW